VRKERSELGEDHEFETSRGKVSFATGDRIQIIGTDKPRGLLNGHAGTITSIEDTTIHMQFDGRAARAIAFDATQFKEFRHGYAGTIYKGQGRTLDQTYLYHSEHWRSAASYVALTRHRDKAEVFVARNTAASLKELARQMARVDNRKAASHYYQAGDTDSGKAASQSAVRTGLERAGNEPDSFETDLARARREASKPQDREVAGTENVSTKEDAEKKRSRDRGGGRSL
jgi:hypothetical protein